MTDEQICKALRADYGMALDRKEAAARIETLVQQLDAAFRAGWNAAQSPNLLDTTQGYREALLVENRNQLACNEALAEWRSRQQQQQEGK